MADKFPDPKVGDPVAYYSAHSRGPRPSSRQVIERVTATQIIVQGTRYKRSTGDEVGQQMYFYRSSVSPWDAALDAEEANAKRAADLFKQIEGVVWLLRVRNGNDRKWTAADLERLAALVETFEDGAREVEAAIDA